MIMARMATSVACGTVLGGLAGCFPLLAFFVARFVGHHWFSIPNRFVPGTEAIFAIAMLMIYVPVGAVCGLIGGVLYGLKQRLLTAASLGVGVLGGGILAWGVHGIDESVFPVWMLFLQLAGVLLGISRTVFSWRRVSR